MVTPKISRADITAAIQRNGFDDWVSSLDSSLLDRPSSRPEQMAGTGRHAAVTAILAGGSSTDPETQMVLIRRSQQLRHHAGQMAFPGGRQEPDEDLLRTAIRETEEEIGVSLKEPDIVGSLRSIYLPPSDFTLTPFVAWLDQLPRFEIQPEEVDDVITVPLRSFLDPAAQTIANVVRDNGERADVPCYQYQSHIIWGATALVISELAARLGSVERCHN